MALAFRVNQPTDLAVVLGAHDIFISILNELRPEFPQEEMKETYTAPFVFLHGKNKRPDDKGGWLIFTPLLPWTHEVHHVAVDELKRIGMKNVSVEKSVEGCQHTLKHRDDTVSIFTTHGGYPLLEDIGPDLDERAVRITCDTLGWKVPIDWKEKRKEFSRMSSAISAVDFIALCNKEKCAGNKNADEDNQTNDNGGETANF
ncbi:hypothetical protein ACHAXN_008804 [Cyclotella atomus]|jgi:hypothetical protein